MSGPSARNIRRLSRPELNEFVSENVTMLLEDEALAAVENPFVTPAILQKIAQDARLSAYYSVRVKLVAHRMTPQMYAAKLVHYLYWFDLLRLSVDVTVPAPVRRAIDTQLLARITKLTLGERIASARRCSAALIKHLLFDSDPRVFEALLLNARLREEELLALAASELATPEQLRMLAADPKWSFRYAIRRAIALNRNTPRAVAAAQLRHLTPADLRDLHSNPHTSVYVQRCIERLAAHAAQCHRR